MDGVWTMKPCYSKELLYVIPEITCSDCNKILKSGNALYTIVIVWGSSKTVCKKCYDKYEVDESLHELSWKEEE